MIINYGVPTGWTEVNRKVLLPASPHHSDLQKAIEEPGWSLPPARAFGWEWFGTDEQTCEGLEV